jgi:hypothetical protein
MDGLAGWKPGDPIPGVRDTPPGQARALEDSVKNPGAGQVEQLVQPRAPAEFDFILNLDWEAVEDDFSEDESE